MSGQDLPATVADAAAALRRGRLTSVALTSALLERADQLDRLLGTYLARFDEEALAAAARADRELAAGGDRGPLHGIPVGVKDIFPSVEGPTTAQCAAFDGGWGDGTDAPAVARLRRGGAVIMGKVTTMELTLGTPDPEKPYPLPRNPWDVSRWPGGSSSGSGSGVAAGLFLASLGSDTGGSIRLPAAFCGVTGLVPTYGRVPRAGAVPLAWTIDRAGPLARSVRDCFTLLDALADPGAPHLAGPDGPDGPADLGGLRIGVVREGHFPPGTGDDVHRAFEAAVGVLERLGATLVEVALPYLDEGFAAALLLTATEAFTFHRPALGRRWEDFGRPARRSLAAGALSSGADYVQAQRVRTVVAGAVAGLFGQVDLVATPTAVIGAIAYDEHGGVPLEETVGRVFTPYWNPIGNPLLALPIGFTDAGLPLSLQLAAPPFADGLLLRVGDAYQQATDWHLQLPPLLTADPARLPPVPEVRVGAPSTVVGDRSAGSGENPEMADVAARLHATGLRPPSDDLQAIAAAWVASRPLRQLLWNVAGMDGVEPAVTFRPPSP